MGMTLSSDAATVAAYADQLLPLATASLGKEYRYQSLPLCVIDAIYSIGVRYSGTKRVVERYCAYTKQPMHRHSDSLPDKSEQESISTFCDRPEQADPAFMAMHVYENRQRTSTKNGILKAEAVARFARCLQSHGVEFLQDVPVQIHEKDNKTLATDIKAIPGQGSGISYDYFLMLSGSDEFIKPDRMVVRFLNAALSRKVNTEDASQLLQGACCTLREQYPHLTPRLLDHEVWKYQRTITSESLDCRSQQSTEHSKPIVS